MFRARGLKRRRGETRASGKCGKGLNAGRVRVRIKSRESHGVFPDVGILFFREWQRGFSNLRNWKHFAFFQGTRTALYLHELLFNAVQHLPGFDRQATITVVEATIQVYAMLREDRHLGGVPSGWSQWHIWSAQCLTTKHTSLAFLTVLCSPVHTPFFCPASAIYVSLFFL